MIMQRINGWLEKARSGQRGVTALEYALIAALIAVAIIGAVSAAGTGVSKTFTKVSEKMPK